MNNPFARTVVEYHILQSFPVTCLNRDDVGAPKNAMVGGVPRARVSSQCWKRQVRQALHESGVHCGIRTKQVSKLIANRCMELGDKSEEEAQRCGDILASMLVTDTLYFISPTEINILAQYAKEKNFILPTEEKKSKGNKDEEDAAKVCTLPKKEVTTLTKQLKNSHSAADALDIALFGRMVAQAPELNIQAASAFSHAISTHRVSNEVEFFTALDDLKEGPGSAHMGSLEYNSATYYRYVSLDLGQLWENLGGETIEAESMKQAVAAFTKALYVAVPAARQTTQSGSCPWEYARIFIRKGQRIQAPCDKPVRAQGDGYLTPSIKALDEFLMQQEKLSGSLFGKFKEFTFGVDLNFNIDALASALSAFVDKGGVA